MFDERGIIHIGLHVTRGLLVSLSVDHEVRTFVSIGTEEQRTFLFQSIEGDQGEDERCCSYLEIAGFQHGDGILR